MKKDDSQLGALREQNSSEDDFLQFGDFFEGCIGYVDMIDSTLLSSSIPPEKQGDFYGLFINPLARTAIEHGATVFKIEGDAFYYLFKKSEQDSEKICKQSIQCGMEIINTLPNVNKLRSQVNLPEVRIRLCSEYGTVIHASCKTSLIEDVFGDPVNICAKINSSADPNCMVIGSNCFDQINSQDPFHFFQIGYCNIGNQTKHSVFKVKSK